ncbi:MAG TPA: STAS domain-containing protein [Gemmatimonadales bacterium]|nr:STAS domain-containing protein [Gemmatimonadales bacterium]
MKLSTVYDGDRAVVHLSGRLDGEWADHLSATLEEFLREGTRSVLLEMSEVTYLSSAGTQVLALRYHDFSGLRGELRVANPSPVVQDALRLSGLEDRLLWEEPAEIPIAARTRSSVMMHRLTDHTREDWRVQDAAADKGHYEFTVREAGAALALTMYGNPATLFTGTYHPADCHSVEFPDAVFGLGLGALGTTPEDCLPRTGELLAAGGVAAYLPTDGALVADYQVGTRRIPPRCMLVHGLSCAGHFSHLGRFRTHPDQPSVPLSDLARVALDSTGASIAGVVIAAETVGLVGASLKRPPGLPGQPPLHYAPNLEDWVSFTAEPSFNNMTALIAGVVARAPTGRLEEFLRPIGGTAGLLGHFHAVAFPYEPLPQRTVALQALVLRLFGHHKIRGVLHLLADDRGAEGAGESTFLRGLCWAGPVTRVEESAT